MHCTLIRYLVVAVVLSSIATPAGAAQEFSSTPPNEQISRFLDRVAKAGYLVQEGSVGKLDLDYNYCLGAAWSAFYPNPDSSYLGAALPPSPVQPAPNWTPNNFRLREDEAMVVIGTVPPPSAYLSLIT